MENKFQNSKFSRTIIGSIKLLTAVDIASMQARIELLWTKRYYWLYYNGLIKQQSEKST